MLLSYKATISRIVLLSLIPLSGVFGVDLDAQENGVVINRIFQPIVPIIVFSLLLNIKKIRLKPNWIISFLCFQLISFSSYTRSDWLQFATSEYLKSLMLFPFAFGFYLLLDSLEKYLDRATKFLILTCVILFGWLAYKVIFVHGRGYLSVDWMYGTDVGRNSLCLFIFLLLMLVSALPPRFAKSPNLISFIFLLSASVLTASKMAILFLVMFSFALLTKTKNSFPFFQKKRTSLGRLGIGILVLFVAFLFFAGESSTRLLSAFSLSEDSSNERLEMIKVGIFCFLDGNILFGNGMKNYLSCTEEHFGQIEILHNDHLSILNNFGLLGYFLFFFLVIDFVRVKHLKRNSFTSFCLLLSTLGILLVIDAYNSLIFALLLGSARYASFSKEKSPTKVARGLG